MTPKDFVKELLPYARESERKTGISAVAIMAQAATESAWGRVAPGNMFFGVKDTDGINGNEQLLTTTEYLSTPTAKFPTILRIVKVAERRWKYTVKDYFRKYATPEESFTDHANFLKRNPRYTEAMKYRDNPYVFIAEIAKAGYATDPNYAKTVSAVARMIEREIKAL